MCIRTMKYPRKGVSPRTSVKGHQAPLEQARAAYREQAYRDRTAKEQEKQAWQRSLDAVSYAEFCRTDENSGGGCSYGLKSKITGNEQEELLLVKER